MKLFFNQHKEHLKGMHLKMAIRVLTVSFFFTLAFFSALVLPSTKSNCQAEDLSATIPQKYAIMLYESESIPVKVYFKGKKVDALDYDMTYVRSNKNAKIDTDTYDKIYLYGNKIGTCKVKFKISYNEYDSETYEVVKTHTITKTCTIKTIYQKNLRIIGYLSSYKTRSNTFTLHIENLTSKNIIIYSGGAKVLEDDYKSFDRALRLANGVKRIVIKPLQKKNVAFKVIGNTTWPYVKNFTLKSTWLWNGKKQNTSAYIGGIYKKVGKKDVQIGFE